MEIQLNFIVKLTDFCEGLCIILSYNIHRANVRVSAFAHVELNGQERVRPKLAANGGFLRAASALKYSTDLECDLVLNRKTNKSLQQMHHA